MLPERILITDGNLGTARQLQRVLESHGLLRKAGEGSVTLQTTGNSEMLLPVMSRLYAKGLEIS